MIQGHSVFISDGITTFGNGTFGNVTFANERLGNGTFERQSFGGFSEKNPIKKIKFFDSDADGANCSRANF
jgi:hypothetical protein